MTSPAPEPADVKQIKGVDKWVESQRTAREKRAQKEADFSDSRPLNLWSQTGSPKKLNSLVVRDSARAPHASGWNDSVTIEAPAGGFRPTIEVLKDNLEAIPGRRLKPQRTHAAGQVKGKLGSAHVRFSGQVS